jgi:hypothetical protein
MNRALVGVSRQDNTEKKPAQHDHGHAIVTSGSDHIATVYSYIFTAS